MRTVAAILIATATALASTLSVQPSATAAPPRVAPGDCQMLSATMGPANVWQTVFWAGRKNILDEEERIFVWPCFDTEANCKAWLYWAQGDWDIQYGQFEPCRKGMR